MAAFQLTTEVLRRHHPRVARGVRRVRAKLALSTPDVFDLPFALAGASSGGCRGRDHSYPEPQQATAN